MARSSLHIQISAHDRPGILAETLGFIVDAGWNVVDIKQFVFNGMLNLSILLDGDDTLISPLKDWPLRQSAISDFDNLRTVSYTHLTLPTNREV